MSLNEITRPTVARFAEASGKRRGGRSPARLYSVALLTAGAASIHISAAVNHLPEYLPWGIFFICLAMAQVAVAAVVVLVPSRSLFVAASVGTAGVIGVWVISRTVGVPLAPVPWSPEPIGALDLTATLIEAVSIVLFVLLIRRPPGARRPGVNFGRKPGCASGERAAEDPHSHRPGREHRGSQGLDLQRVRARS